MIGFYPYRRLWVAFALMLIFGFGIFSEAYAQSRRQRANPTKSSIKAHGRSIQDKATIRWESLSPEQQAYFEKKAKEKAQTGKTTGKEFWDALSASEQEEAIAKTRGKAKMGRQKWNNLPE